MDLVEKRNHLLLGALSFLSVVILTGCLGEEDSQLSRSHTAQKGLRVSEASFSPLGDQCASGKGMRIVMNSAETGSGQKAEGLDLCFGTEWYSGLTPANEPAVPDSKSGTNPLAGNKEFIPGQSEIMEPLSAFCEEYGTRPWSMSYFTGERLDYQYYLTFRVHHDHGCQTLQGGEVTYFTHYGNAFEKKLDLRLIRLMPNLKVLDLSSDFVTGWESLEIPTSLKHLGLPAAPEMNWTRVLGDAQQLEALSIHLVESSAEYLDVSFLDRLPNLKFLRSEVPFKSMQPLYDHPTLQHVQLNTMVFQKDLGASGSWLSLKESSGFRYFTDHESGFYLRTAQDFYFY